MILSTFGFSPKIPFGYFLTASFPHCLYFGHPFSYQPAKPWSSRISSFVTVISTPRMYGHRLAKTTTCIITWQSPGPTRSSPLAWPRTYGHRPRSRGQQPSPSGPSLALALPGQDPQRPPSPNPHPRQAEGIPLTRRLISLIFEARSSSQISPLSK